MKMESVIGFEPTIQLLQSCALPLGHTPLTAGGISMCGQNHLSHIQAVYQPGRDVALPAICLSAMLERGLEPPRHKDTGT